MTEGEPKYGSIVSDSIQLGDSWLLEPLSNGSLATKYKTDKGWHVVRVDNPPSKCPW